jgi:hypothetical protein
MVFSSSLSFNFTLAFIAIFASLPAVQATKFETWYYWYNHGDNMTLSNLASGECKSYVDGYFQSKSMPNDQTRGIGSVSWCYMVEDCMLDKMRPSYLQNYQAAAVIFGIMV